MNEVNELFTKENVEKIYVPDIVKDDLLSIIEEKLSLLKIQFGSDLVKIVCALSSTGILSQALHIATRIKDFR